MSSARNAAIGPPTKAPTTGITKKPTTAPRATIHTRDRGEPLVAARRPGRTVAAANPARTTTVATTRTVHRTASFASPANAHRSTAPHTSRSPGSSGTIVPAIPATISNPTTSSSAPMAPELPGG
jgi:hypothetical protein